MHDSGDCVHELTQNRETDQELVSRLNKTSKALRRSEQQVQSLENRISEQSDQLVSSYNDAQSGINKISPLEKQAADLTGELNCSKAQNGTDRTHLN